MAQKSQTTSSRLLSLDVMRGITIAGMILVNNPGSWGSFFAPLRHAEWNGLTPTDLVFPSFMFIMGVSMFLSYKKFEFKLSKQTFVKLLRRSVLLFVIGLTLNWLGLFCRHLSEFRLTEISLMDKLWQSATSLEHLRTLGVLQRLAIISFFGSLIVLLFKHKTIPYLVGFVLFFYWVIIVMSQSLELTHSNLVAILDRSVLGENHMYIKHLANGNPISFDPDRLLSTLPGIAHVLIGFLAGKIISEQKDKHKIVEKLLLFGSVILLGGFLLDYGMPINKSLWSSSFVLVTCGIALLMLGLLMWIIDINGKKSWTPFFESFGVNPMFIYVVAGVLTTLLSSTGFAYNGAWMSLHSYFYVEVLTPVFGDLLGSLAYALCFVSINWIIGHRLYKKKIYIKL